MTEAVPAIPYWRLSLFYFFYFAVLGGFMPYWGLYLQGLGFTEADIGQLIAISMLTRIVAPAFWGWLADRTGQRMALVRAGAMMVCVFWAGILFVGDRFWMMALVLFAYSFFQNAILAQFEAVTIAHLGERRAQYGRIRLWGSLGFIATVAGFGWLFDYLEVRHLPVLLLICALTAALFSLVVPAPVQAKKEQRSQPIGRTLLQPGVMAFLLVHFLLQFSHAPYYSFFSQHLEANGYSHSTIGMMWSLGVLAEVLAFTQTHRLLRRFSESFLIQACLWLAMIRWVVIGVAVDEPLLIWTVQGLHAFSFAVFHATAMQWIFREFSEGQQGQGQAAYSALWGLGVAMGSWAAGGAWSVVGPAWVYGGAALSCVLASGVLWGARARLLKKL